MKTKAPSANRKSAPVKLTATRNNQPAKAAKPDKPKKAVVAATAFTKDNFDTIPLVMASARTPMRALMKKIKGAAFPETMPTTKRFLVVTGGKGGYVSEVKSDDGDFYVRERRIGGLAYGSLSMFKDVTGLNVEAHIVNKSGLIALAAKLGKVVTVSNHENEDVTVALLNPIESKVVAAVTRTPEGRIRVVTMHHVSRNSCPEEQFTNPRDSRKPKAFIASLAS